MKKLNYFMTALYLTVANSTMDVYAAALLTRNGTSTTLSKSEIIERQDAEIDKQFERKLALEKQQHGILEKKIAKEKIFEMRETLTDFAQELQSQIKSNDISENKYILLRELQNKIFDAINKADYVAKNFDRDTSSYYTQMKLKAARAGQMARSGMDAASEYSSKAYNTASDYSSKAYNSEMAAQAGSMARGTAAGASDMASQSYNSETAKKMGDGVRSMGTAMGIPKMSSWSFGKRKEVAE